MTEWCYKDIVSAVWRERGGDCLGLNEVLEGALELERSDQDMLRDMSTNYREVYGVYEHVNNKRRDRNRR